MKTILTVITGFVHDLATGLWMAIFINILWLDRMQRQRDFLSGVIGELQKEFFMAGIFCMVVVLITGIGRSFTYSYTGAVYGKEAEGVRRRLLIIKHVILISMFVIGTYWEYQITYK